MPKTHTLSRCGSATSVCSAQITQAVSLTRVQSQHEAGGVLGQAGQVQLVCGMGNGEGVWTTPRWKRSRPTSSSSQSRHRALEGQPAQQPARCYYLAGWVLDKMTAKQLGNCKCGLCYRQASVGVGLPAQP